MEKKAYKIKDKDKDLQVNGHAKIAVEKKFPNKMEFSTDNLEPSPFCQINLIYLVQIKILIGFCQMMNSKPKHLISSQLKR